MKDPDKHKRNLFQFADELKSLLKETSSFLSNREPESEAFQAFSSVAARTVENYIGEVDTLVNDLVEDGEALNVFSQVIEETNGIEVLANQMTLASQESTEAASGVSLSTGLSIGRDIFDKAAEYIPSGPLKGAIKDIAYILKIAARLTKTTGDQIKRIEQKVASLQESINGKPFPKGQIKGPVQRSKSQPLRDEVQEIEDKIEHFFHLITGNPVPRKSDGSIDDVPSETPRPQLPGSLLWMAWELEYKLEHVFTRLFGGNFPRNQDGWVVSPIPYRPERSLTGEMDRLHEMIKQLTKLLGKTLYDADWDVDPGIPPSSRTVPRGARPVNDTPPRSVKDELHDLENMLNEVIRLLWIIINILRKPPIPPEYPPPPPPPVPPIPPEDPPPPPPQFPKDLKRIFVYDEGVFEASGSSDKKEILVRTGAFDLAGWIDLSELQDGDKVLIEFFVRLPGNVRRLYRQRILKDKADARLYKLSDIVGPGWIVGNAVDIVLAQTSSVSGYQPPLKIAYQFIVESQ